MDPLITLTQLKAASGNFPNPAVPSPQDVGYTDAINAASMLIRNFTGMKFEIATGVATPRSFEYDGSGYLDIDECTSITAVSQTPSYSGATTIPLTTDQWSAQPYNNPVKLWIRMPEVAYGMSPEMGFTWNLDTLGYKGNARPNIVNVTATWGWPTIPYDVQRATIWTALSIFETPKPYQQESIENYSRTRGPGENSEAIPERAQVALMPYIIPRL